jgi:hypothetical protein
LDEVLELGLEFMLLVVEFFNAQIRLVDQLILRFHFLLQLVHQGGVVVVLFHCFVVQSV